MCKPLTHVPRASGSLAQPPSLALRLQECEDVALADRPLHIADERTSGELRRRLVHELHSDLDDTTSGSGPAQYFLDLGKLWRVGIHGCSLICLG
eukprot:CAMPEP_0183437206 /NCGR_PEP_ID=MMETSP0370-20130417/72031_1 /TAXON_ID=268820 /ORGANISM="Peridinium aciculiferum, Strain PAER-2" /LENGTH=94 /DNA_ID=CAMNT_0025624917 /DNA_START=74 /DNA_END=358 /DNA_ORIENTATION=+